jgi:hypothetical protein
MEASIGAKNREIRKQMPVETAVRPVRPPSEMPALLSMKAVTGDNPSSEPMEMQKASTQNAIVDRGKSALSLRALLQNRAIE